ncbi:MAG: MarR family transcriptional regulator [Chloroflexi bacterium]|nr:MAG: MarR family transcriptional regulator [Chloroflexota bacterium]TMB94865.1 MAG: MarR family transcriptional regulator [Chloroflexota bacterium]TMC27267.1 MAG: MarR family transcriptional regulator [Chloroflexota bacterium]TMC34118.1 MAG: MarR family transcriptional regulator [Chloroflexota bacterium]TMC57848.1 MAG: MarR family transcriptional regulator [Chloroflexota bacterium]
MSSGARPERDVADRLHSAAIHLLRRVRRSDPLTGVSAAQLSALSVLMGGPRTLGEMAAAEQVRPPTMSTLVAEMERLGLVRRSRDPADARVARIEMTAKGRRVLAKGRELRIADIERRVRRLRPEQVASVREAVSIIEAMLKEE